MAPAPCAYLDTFRVNAQCGHQRLRRDETKWTALSMRRKLASHSTRPTAEVLEGAVGKFANNEPTNASTSVQQLARALLSDRRENSTAWRSSYQLLAGVAGAPAFAFRKEIAVASFIVRDWRPIALATKNMRVIRRIWTRSSRGFRWDRGRRSRLAAGPFLHTGTLLFN